MMDEFDIIETPENVDLQRRLAGIGSRFLAGLLDHLLMAGVVLLIVLLVILLFNVSVFGLDARMVREAATWMTGLFVVLGFLVYWGYFVLFESWMNGQTPGKRYMKIRVVQQEGGAIFFSAVAIRNLVRPVDFIGFYAVAGLVMFLTRKAQRLGDLAAGTVVVSEEIPDYAAQSDTKATVRDEISATVAALEATQLKPQEYRLLHNYWLRRDQLSLEAREQLLPKLLRPILERTGTPLAGNTLAVLERHVEELMRQAHAANPDHKGKDSADQEQP
jgi:uncharacterized RDD family membrane protein YckC